MARRAKGEGTLYETPTGYRGYVTLDGKRNHFRATTKTLALAKKTKLINEHATNTKLAQTEHTLGSWVQHWLKATESKHAANTHSNYTYQFGHYYSQKIRDTPLAKVTVEMLENEYAQFVKLKLAGSTRLQLHSIVHTSLKMAQQRGHILVNPASIVVDKPTRNKSVVKAISTLDVAAIEYVLETSRLKARWHLGLALGLRPAETLGLEWSAINFDDRTIHIRQQVQNVGKNMIIVPLLKTDAGLRSLPLPEYLAAMLLEHRITQLSEVAGKGIQMWSPDEKPHSWVFTSARRPGVPLSVHGDTTEWRKILVKAGVAHTRRYAARHTAATFLVSRGVDVVTVAHILGHADPGLTMRTYVHSVDEKVRAVANVLDDKAHIRPTL